MNMRITKAAPQYGWIVSSMFFAGLLLGLLATLDALYLVPAAAVGVVLPAAPFARKKTVRYGILILLAAFLVVRFEEVFEGFQLLANQLFALSEQTQAYEYNYFTVNTESAVETVLWLSLAAGLLCSLWGNRLNWVLTALWCVLMVYFGVTPDAHWLILAAFFGTLCCTPHEYRWFYGALIGIAVMMIGIGCIRFVPEPRDAVSALDEELRDILSLNSVVYEQTPVPVEVPEPEIVPPPAVEQEQPDHGVQKQLINILFVVLAALTLMILFVPAVINDRAAKRSEQNRAGMNDPDHAKSIHAMYLYAGRWRMLDSSIPPVPTEIYAIWQEAAFSDHIMSETQRLAVREYMETTARTVWANANWKKRMHIRYRIAL